MCNLLWAYVDETPVSVGDVLNAGTYARNDDGTPITTTVTLKGWDSVTDTWKVFGETVPDPSNAWAGMPMITFTDEHVGIWTMSFRAVDKNGINVCGAGPWYLTISGRPPSELKWKCSGAPSYSCVRASDGVYDTFFKCTSACKPVPDKYYNCISGQCTPVTGTVGYKNDPRCGGVCKPTENGEDDIMKYLPYIAAGVGVGILVWLSTRNNQK